MAPVLAAIETMASVAAPIAAETVVATTAPLMAETVGAAVLPAATEIVTAVPDIAAANIIAESATTAAAAPTSELAAAQIKNIASGEIFPTKAPDIASITADSGITKNIPSQEATPVENVTPDLAPEDMDFLEDTTSKLPKKNNTADISQNEKSSPQNERTKPQPETLEQRISKFNTDLQRIMQEFNKGIITKQEFDRRVDENQKARKEVLESLAERYKDGDENMTSFEKEIAKKGLEMQYLMQEINSAPEAFDAMEKYLQGLQKKYRELGDFPINAATANSTEAQINTAERKIVADEIIAQATHMSRYVNIVDRNVNEFIRTNSDIENQIGVRNGFHHMLVSIGTGIKKRFNDMDRDVLARQIARTGEMP